MSVAAVSLGCVSKCGLERTDRCPPRPAHRLFAFKLLDFSDTEEFKSRNACPSHWIWYSNIYILLNNIKPAKIISQSPTRIQTEISRRWSAVKIVKAEWFHEKLDPEGVGLVCLMYVSLWTLEKKLTLKNRRPDFQILTRLFVQSLSSLLNQDCSSQVIVLQEETCH